MILGDNVFGLRAFVLSTRRFDLGPLGRRNWVAIWRSRKTRTGEVRAQPLRSGAHCRLSVTARPALHFRPYASGGADVAERDGRIRSAS